MCEDKNDPPPLSYEHFSFIVSESQPPLLLSTNNINHSLFKPFFSNRTRYLVCELSKLAIENQESTVREIKPKNRRIMVLQLQTTFSHSSFSFPLWAFFFICLQQWPNVYVFDYLS